MTTNELIAILRDEDDPNVLDYIQEAADTLQLQQARIMELETELKDERYRHDRYVDFELAQAAELARVKAERRWIPVTERRPTDADTDDKRGYGCRSLISWRLARKSWAYPANVGAATSK